jgi:phosphoribosyl 1,2-cyclic phosphate phosphodiesterase
MSALRTFDDYATIRLEFQAMQEMQITFLGTGTSHGIPVIGCGCAVCKSRDPRDKRLRTSIHVQTPGFSFIVDTTPDFRTQCLREEITRVDAVLYTHAHVDHILGFDDLRRFCELENKNMPILASAPTLESLARVFQYAFDGSARFPNYIRPEPRVVAGPFSLGGLDIVPVELPHGRMTTNGFVFEKNGRRLFAYYTDCAEVPPAAEEAARDVEVLVIDALRHHSHQTHFTVQGALEAARRIRARQTYFIHMCHELGHAETEAGLPTDVRLSYDGLRLDF